MEEEYQLIDRDTGALRSMASAVRGMDWTGELVKEVHETQVEIGTPVCRSAAEVARELARLRFQAATVSATRDLALVAAGTHPYSLWSGHAQTEDRRYERIAAKYGRIVLDEHIFGMHIHIAVPRGVDRLGLINVARHFLPHLLALSASSPYFEGDDTGFASYRSILWRRWPASGIPPRFASEADYQRLVDELTSAGVLLDAGTVYWAIRAHARYPTIEVRVTDVCPRLRDAAAIAALARVIVYAIACGRIVEPEASEAARLVESDILRANEWQAARHGLDAMFIDTMAKRSPRTARQSIRALIHDLMPVSRALGDASALADIEAILERGNAADRMRRIKSDRGDLGEVVEWLRAETLVGTGLDRRAAQRPEAATASASERQPGGE